MSNLHAPDAADPPFDLGRARAALPALGECTYLNTGTFGLVAEPVAERAHAAMHAFDTRGMAAHDQALAWQEQARARVAGMLGCQADEVALNGNATDGVNLVAFGLTWQPGDEVVISDQEHPAMNVPWYTLARRIGLRVRRFAIPPDGDPDETIARIAAQVTPRTRLIGASHVSHQTGVRTPARAICAFARERGILSLIDGAQAVGVMPIDVREIGCDFYASNGHKWLCSPKGIGFWYGRYDLLERMEPAYVGAGSTDYDVTRPERTDLVAGARRFEYGSRGHALYAGLTAAIDYLEDLGWEAIWAHQRRMADYLKRQVQSRGWPLLTPLAWERSAGLCAFRVPGRPDVDALYQELIDERRIYAQRTPSLQSLRISTAYFTSREDIDALLAALDTLAG